MSRTAYEIVKGHFDTYIADAEAGIAKGNMVSRIFNFAPGTTGIKDAREFLGKIQDSDDQAKVVLALTQAAYSFGARKRILTLTCLEEIYVSQGRGINSGDLVNHSYLADANKNHQSMIKLLGEALVGTALSFKDICELENLTVTLLGKDSKDVPGLNQAHSDAVTAEYLKSRSMVMR